MPPATRANDWNEYKRLVLAELERHEESIAKLQEIAAELNSAIQICQNDNNELYDQIDKLQLQSPQMNGQVLPEARWKFYAAVATVIGTAIVSIISLITAILGGRP